MSKIIFGFIVAFALKIELGQSVKLNDTLTRVELTTIDPTAVCNDGTPAIYGWKKSPTGSNKWLIFLAGGASCWD